MTLAPIIAHLTRLRFARLNRILSRNERKLNLGPPYGREPHVAPSVREGYRDLDGMDHAVRVRSRALMMRKQADKLRRPLDEARERV